MPTLDEIITFSVTIEDIAVKTKLNHIDAILLYCERNAFDVEVAATLINSSLMSKIEDDAENLHLIPKVPKLPI